MNLTKNECKDPQGVAEQPAKLLAELNATPISPLEGEAPILAELRAVGYEFGSLHDLRESGTRYRSAIPILLAWVPLVDKEDLAKELVRTLSVPWAKPAAAAPLIELFRRADSLTASDDWYLRWTIGSALEIVSDDTVFDAMVQLAQDRRYGRAREMIVLWLRKSKRREAIRVLIQLSEDPDVYGHAVAALAKMKAPAAHRVFEAKLQDARAWIRKEARKGLEKLNASAC